MRSDPVYVAGMASKHREQRKLGVILPPVEDVELDGVTLLLFFEGHGLGLLFHLDLCCSSTSMRLMNQPVLSAFEKVL